MGITIPIAFIVSFGPPGFYYSKTVIQKGINYWQTDANGEIYLGILDSINSWVKYMLLDVTIERFIPCDFST